MNSNELEQILVKNGVQKGNFIVGKIGGYEALCIYKDTDSSTWKVVYNSRGTNTFEQDFPTENSACEFFYNEMKKDYGFDDSVRKEIEKDIGPEIEF